MTTAVSHETWAYEDYVPFETVARLLQSPTKLCNEQYKYVIPSFKLGRDGPLIKSVFMITDHYLSEIRVMDKEEQFDFLLLRCISNYLVDLGFHEVKGETSEKAMYQTARITLVHSTIPDFASEISYVGHQRDAWLEKVFDALPLSLLSKNVE